MKTMKTAFSLPNPLFKRAERLAKRLRLSRSELYARAVQDLVERLEDEEITRRLNEAYGRDGKESELDPVFAAHVRRMLRRVEW